MLRRPPAELKALVVVDHELANAAELAGKLELFVGLYTHNTPSSQAAQISLPRAMYVEQSGSFTNVLGMKQSFKKALEPLGEAKGAAELAALIAKSMGKVAA